MMTRLLNWTRKHKFETHVAAFLLMILPPIAMYLAATQGATQWTWILIGFVITGNLLVLIVK
jgi:hypothetical protein